MFILLFNVLSLKNFFKIYNDLNVLAAENFDFRMEEGLDVNITCSNLHKSTNVAVESIEQRNNEKQNQNHEATTNINLQNIKMPSKIQKRGRPRGFGNTVIGLKKSRKKNE